MDETASSAAERPIWRRIVDYPLVAMVIAVAVIMLGGFIAAKVTPLVVRSTGIKGAIAFDLVFGVLFILLYKGVIRYLGEPRRDDLRGNGALRLLAIGLAAGALLFGLITAVAAALGVYRIVGPGDTSDLVAALITSAIFPAISEEILFRGVLFRWLEQFAGSWVALLLTSALFGAMHLANPNASPIAAVGIAMEAGLMLGAAYMLARSLWLPIGLHAAWNFMQGEVLDIPVSGTTVHGLVDARLSGNPLLTGDGFGLEASIIAMVIATGFGLWLLAKAIKAGEVMSPIWSHRRARRLEAEAA